MNGPGHSYQSKFFILHSDYLINIAVIFESQMVIGDNALLFALLLIFCIAAIIQLFYYLYFFLTPARFRHTVGKSEVRPVSVIICARNEEDNLKSFLPAVLEQNYPDFEVIVVNDCSEDDTFNVLGEFLKKYPHLRVSNITKDPKFTHNKKLAQFIGIKAAKNDILLFTDADCMPVTGEWISGMVSHFEGGTDIVLGYGGYIRGKGLLNRYIRYESMTIAMQYFGLAIKGLPYMGVGRNLAYRRSLFFDRKGFGNYSHLASGDDDLFVNSNATPVNTAVEFRREAHTRSVAAASGKEFLKQKRRHLSTARYYRFIHKVILAGEPATRVLFYALFIVLLTQLYLWPVVLGIFAARLSVQVVVLVLTQHRLDERGLLPYSLAFDLLSPLINLSIYLSNLRNRPGRFVWK
jgi:cellulose synthase/poly-beta-1,6-N-acetylglucosamine synthase-like glycosyltransferase